MLEARSESVDKFQTLSEKQGIGILNTKCAVRPLTKSDAATADVAAAITFCPRIYRIDSMTQIAKVFPVPSRASRK